MRRRSPCRQCERHRTAVADLKEAGLTPYIDARLGDAHEIVPALPGPFNFVFSDVDKEWYKNYFVAVWPKMTSGGCFTAHNVSGRGAGGGIRDFLVHVKALPDGVTTTLIQRAGPASASAERSEFCGGEMSIENALASVAVKDLGAAEAWYAKLLGRAGSKPMAEVIEWTFPNGGGLQVYTLAERAGQGSFTLAVRNIADEIAKLHAMGVDTSDQTSSPRVKTVMIVDPAGNHIALAEALDPSLAK